MCNQTLFNLIGLVFNTTGAVILAISYYKYSSVIHKSLSDAESWSGVLTGDGLMEAEFKENTKRRVYLLKQSSRLMISGIILLIIGFIFQGIALFV